ncbi:MAG TPA: DinB family protein [Marmoricola sp.]
MSELDPKAVLHDYLRAAREALLWKLDGLDEYDLRLPRTGTGTNLLGIVKHCLNVEAGYFGPTFGRAWPSPGELVPESAYDEDPQADWYATEDESAAGLVDLYRRVQAFADETVDALPLDARGRVPWWSPERNEVTLFRVIVHVTEDISRHAGHADILREQIDGAVGMRVENTNVPEIDWGAYRARLIGLAESVRDEQ